MACFWVNLVAVSENCGDDDGQPLDFIMNPMPYSGSSGAVLFVYADPEIYDENYSPQYPELAAVAVAEITGYYSPVPGIDFEDETVYLEGSTLVPITPIPLERVTFPQLDYFTASGTTMYEAGIDYGQNVVTIRFDGGPDRLVALYNYEGH